MMFPGKKQRGGVKMKKGAKLKKSNHEEMAKRLFAENYGKWIGYALKHNIKRENAEDTIQNIMIRFLEKGDRLTLLPGSGLEAYMMETLKNNLKNVVTRTKSFAALEEAFFPEEESTEEAVLTHLEYESVREAVKYLPQIQKEIIYMIYYQNLDVSQIAGQMGMASNLVRAYKSRAVKKLRKILADIDEGGEQDENGKRELSGR